MALLLFFSSLPSFLLSLPCPLVTHGRAWAREGWKVGLVVEGEVFLEKVVELIQSDGL